MAETCISGKENIVMVLCGHYAVPNERYDYTTGFRTDKNSAGRNVHQMMFNCRGIGGGMSGNGGEGFLRLLEFMPDGKTVEVRTYSPLLVLQDRQSIWHGVMSHMTDSHLLSIERYENWNF